MSVAADSSQPAATTLTMGSTGNTLAVYRLQETSNIEPVKVTDLTVTDVATANNKTALPAFSNVQLWSGSTNLGTGGSAVAVGTSTITNGTQTGQFTPIVASTAAMGTITVVGTPSASTTFTGYVGSIPFTTVIEATSSATGTTALAIATAINTTAGTTASVTATSTNGVVTVTAKTAGSAANAYTLFVVPLQSVTFTSTGLSGGANQTGGQPIYQNTYQQAYTYAFHFSNPIIVPQGNTSLITLKGDVASYSGNGATDNSSHIFSIASSSAVTALGQTSNQPTTVTGYGSGNPMTVLRSTLTVNTSPSSFTQNGKQPLQQIGSITLTANNAGPVELANLKLTFSGSNIPDMGTFLNNVVLKGSNSVDVTASTANSGMGAMVASDTVSPSTGTYVLWTFATSTTNTSSSLVVSPGAPVTLQLWAPTNVITNTGNNVAESLAISIQNAYDAQYYDGTDATAVSTTGAISLPTNAVPLTVSSFSWGQGQ
jgi:hypothetical protein